MHIEHLVPSYRVHIGPFVRKFCYLRSIPEILFSEKCCRNHQAHSKESARDYSLLADSVSTACGSERLETNLSGRTFRCGTNAHWSTRLSFSVRTLHTQFHQHNSAVLAQFLHCLYTGSSHGHRLCTIDTLQRDHRLHVAGPQQQQTTRYTRRGPRAQPVLAASLEHPQCCRLRRPKLISITF